MHGSAEQKGIALSATISPDVPEFICGDESRLRQVLLNLTGNAVKFTQHGRVELRLTREADLSDKVRLRCEVEDTGVGIAAGLQSQLFAPFTQADSSISRK